MELTLYGFTLLKNGFKYDYPFKQCLHILTTLCRESYIALGDSEDETDLEVGKFKNLTTIKTIWDMSLMGDGGKILSQQTNIALAALRKEHQNGWGVYLQTDELIHEKDFDQIKRDIATAEEQGCDAVSFRYYHFWLNHNQIAISKRWYPQEIRAIKLSSNIHSHGDAQGFTGQTKVYQSDVHIFHYGHVRDKEKREAKQELLIKMIRPGEKYKKYKNREEKAFKKTETLPYLGPHPNCMKDRIKKFGDIYQMPDKDIVKVFDPNRVIDQELRARIKSKELEICSKRKRDCLSLEKTLFQKIGLIPHLPTSMKSPIARPWTDKQRMEFLLWYNGIST